MLAQIPADWEQRQSEFQALQKAERTARTLYRRTADEAYKPGVEIIGILDDNAKLEGLTSELETLREQVEVREPADMLDIVGELSKKIGEIEGARDIKNPLSKARSALRAKTPNKEKALSRVDEALAALSAQQVWRAKSGTLHEDLRRYEQSIRSTIGARQQSRLSHEQALFVAGCSAGHRDISLNF